MNHAQEPRYKAELEGVKAPLEVILYLIKRDNLDIYDIPIAKITSDYLEYVDLMERLHIDLAGEFFVLAATLMRIKVQMLLRRDDDSEDPREELVRNLLEYKKMVEAARSFREMEDDRFKVFSRPVPQREKEYRGEAVLDLNVFEIMRVFRQVMAEMDAAEVSEIEPEAFTIEEKIAVIDSRLGEREQVRFRELFEGTSSRLEVVVTFMAVLELIKRLRIKARQEGAFGEIWIYAAGESRAADEPVPADDSGAGPSGA
ncbi:MAG: segregation and condensation protein A [Candidatus Krumholzibacteriia bacterium]